MIRGNIIVVRVCMGKTEDNQFGCPNANVVNGKGLFSIEEDSFIKKNQVNIKE